MLPSGGLEEVEHIGLQARLVIRPVSVHLVQVASERAAYSTDRHASVNSRDRARGGDLLRDNLRVRVCHAVLLERL